MPDQWRVEKHRGTFAAVTGHGNGKRRRSLGTTDRRIADEAVRRLNAELAAAGKLKGPVTLDDVLRIYIDDRRERGTVNVKRIEDIRRTMSATWGKLHPEDLDTATVRAFIAKGRRRGLSDATIRQELSYVQAALNFAVRAGVINKAQKLEKPPAPRPRERWLTKEEVKRLLEACDAFHARLFVALAISTAGRPKHILELTWDRVDLKRRVINLDNPEQERTRKGRARVPINDFALGYLQTAVEAAETAYVVEWMGKPVLSVKTALRAAAARAGLSGVSPYVLRHTAGVWMAQAGVPLGEIAEYMGHESIETTRKHYARYHPDHLRKASEALDL